MAFQSYTFAALKLAAEHAAGKGTFATGNSAGDVVNDALAYFCDLRLWSWRQKLMTLDLTSGQSYVALPTDFVRLLSLYGSSVSVPMLQVSLDDILQMRQYSSATTGGGYAYAIGGATQTATNVLPVVHLEIYPTPSATVVGALSGAYVRQVRALSADVDLPDVPAVCHPALKSLCRAMALSTQDDSEGVDWSTFNRQYDRLAAEDGMVSQVTGRVIGTSQRVGLYNQQNQWRYGEPVVTI